MSLLPFWVQADFEKSAINPRLVDLNVSYMQGRETLHTFNPHDRPQWQEQGRWDWLNWSNSDQAKAVMDGAWLTFGCDVEGREMGPVAYAKPLKARRYVENGKLKSVKYETPSRSEALPLLPWVDRETAEWIFEKHAVAALSGESFWQTVKRCQLPIVIVEGFKKALSVISHGYPAIALRGVSCWHRKGDLGALHEQVGHFAVKGQKLMIGFDQDQKPLTRKQVRGQALKLAQQLELRDSSVSFLEWNSDLGKGLDDVLFAQANNAQEWLDALVNDAKSVHQYKTSDRVKWCLDLITRADSLSTPAERETSGAYLPALPPLENGAIHVVSAGMGCGKTSRIGWDWVASARQQDLFALILSPLNSLGRQTARCWDLPHIHSFGDSPEGQKALWSEVSRQRGIVLCPDSLRRLPLWIWSKRLLVVLDEADQVVRHVVNGETLKSRQAECLTLVARALRQAAKHGAIVLSEASLPDRTIDFVKQISDCDRVRVFRHKRESQHWPCHLHTGSASGFRKQFLSTIRGGTRALLVSTSQRECRKLQMALEGSGLRVYRIDGETNTEGAFTEFFENPDRWLEEHQPDVLILSPSAKSGISIQGGGTAENAYFEQVWGYFPVLATADQLQLLGRFRPAVPRFVFAPKFIHPGADEECLFPRQIRQRIAKTARELEQAHSINRVVEASKEELELIATLESAVADFYVASVSVLGSQKAIAYESLKIALGNAGHRIVAESVLPKDQSISTLWCDLEDRCCVEDAEALASTPVQHDLEWALGILNHSPSATSTERLEARKIVLQDRFPGVDFNNRQTCLEAVYRDRGAMQRGVLLQLAVEDLKGAQEGQAEVVQRSLGGELRLPHKLPKRLHRALLLAKTGVLNLLDDAATLDNNSKQAIAIKEVALRWAADIKYFLRLQIKESQTPMEIVGKFFRKLGLALVQRSRKGSRNTHRDRQYKVGGVDNPVRVQLLEAARHKASEGVSTIRHMEVGPNKQMVDTGLDPLPQADSAPSIDPDLAKWMQPECIADLREMLKLCDSSEARAELESFVPRVALETAMAAVA